jgi:uncharacterized RDD family membrane protein YckC
MSSRQLDVLTPEGVIFSWPLAGPVARFLAWGIDAAVLGAASYFIQRVVGIAGLITADAAAAAGTIAFFVLQIGYGIALEWYWRGQTIGKRVLQIRVLDAQGLRLHVSQIVIRNILRAVDSLPVLYVVGGLSCVWTRHAQRLGDIAAGTVVIRHDSATDPEVLESVRLKYNSLRAYPHLAARLRQRTTPDEAAIALRALVRRNDLDSEARLRLFDELAEHFRAKVEFPPEAVDGLGSENYVRDVVHILFEAVRDCKPVASR